MGYLTIFCNALPMLRAAMTDKPSQRILSTALASLALLAAASGSAHATASGPVVAETTLVIGQARVLHADGASSAVQRGQAIRVGETIQTEIGGHVHLRFVDGGRVSIRPASRLQIDSYAYSADKPQAGAIKFELQEGVVRSITGDWGSAARDRFRLNTPLAAIGVKGTDFVVRATPDATAAVVFTGAITVASQGVCGSGVGPCDGARLLSEDMKGQMLELARMQAVPSLVPAMDLMVASLPTAVADSTGARSQQASASVLSSAADKPLMNESRIASVTALAESSQPPVSTGPLMNWGRYPWATALSGDTFSKQVDAAMLDGYERIASNGAYVLLRDTTAGQTAFHIPTAGSAQFALAQSAASVFRDGSVEPVSVSSASLGVNFEQRTFKTQLELKGAQLGTDVVRAEGLVTSTGVLQTTAGNTSLQGAIGNAAKDAGYVFQKSVPEGTLQGVTLWNR